MAKAKAKSKRMTAAEQSATFKAKARELGANESPEAFDRILRKAAPNPKGSAAKSRK
jgi:hypothetical protein